MNEMLAVKQQLRKHMGQTLGKISREEIISQSECIRDNLMPILEGKRNVACYMSMDTGELDTGNIIESLFEAGKKVYLPRCTHTKLTGHVQLRNDSKNPGNMKDHPHLTFHEMDSHDHVLSLSPKGKYNLKEPDIEDEKLSPLPPMLDAILVPGVAFTSGCSRLGHGAGYYDDFFSRYKLQHSNQLPLLIGIALKQQIVEDIPMDAHDYFLDCILVGDGSIHWRNKPITM
ncbi:5-formyltetrahydrofolate cyclo-ligase [Nakaseomyces glabratus]|uniref:5-formyltetrahydrofolate cyclo-ligase n=1 Tax=Candida glabrata TaxID=5478 RepID=A0A0W0CE68_CANGB|nr:5-formyltetrahydrofolate cyclo-ligase family [Nakaseomyces glabratus]KAH7589671.1 5-formyltetrahydrofolate cyclo-ligase family [Nakaseomyces glabratus]KAH7594842.1 5-formyltetrahydrofolate cyclo-ligase family [Nakaseomyces glabratus]KAH7604341.1 5-formyltetrahydrofolate cyclo-ligase family [Nakaseomyces glabratus]KAH7614333.1 5-formyltetrahydrofolate cyclo-ligase family [Nakaseomyces glabratus]